MIQNNIEISNSKFIPRKPIESQNKRFVRDKYKKKELIPHKPDISLNKRVYYTRPEYRKHITRPDKYADKRIDLNKKQELFFSDNKVYCRGYEYSLPPVNKYDYCDKLPNIVIKSNNFFNPVIINKGVRYL